MHNLQVRIRRLPGELPTPEDFELVGSEAPRIRGGQMLVRAKWLSLDPYVRAFASGRSSPEGLQVGSVLPAHAVAEVLESRHDLFGVGDTLVLETGLQQLCISDGIGAYRLHPGQNPAPSALGALGTPGMMAYFGLLEVARLQAGETVLVSTAAGGVGSMVGQIARLKGARAVGIAGSREQCDWVARSARFAACIDHRTENLSERLRALVPGGAQVYFENVGGELLERIAAGGHLAPGARVVLCGRTAHHDSTEPTASRAQIRSMILRDYERRREEFLKEAIAWVRSDLIVYREDVVEGLENAIPQYCRLMRGETLGKALVRV